MEKSAIVKIKAIKTVLIAGAIIMLLKFVAFFVTHSNAILSDALESIINVVAGAFAYYSLWLAAKPKDADHPYGHGKIEFISAGFEGGLILLTGVGIIYEAIKDMLHPHQLGDVRYGAILSVVSGGANFAMGFFLVRKGKKQNSLLMKANGKHLV